MFVNRGFLHEGGSKRFSRSFRYKRQMGRPEGLSWAGMGRFWGKGAFMGCMERFQAGTADREGAEEMANRQLEMIYILMDKGMVTAEELARRFEVSVRTVYRDVERLSMAGIPVYASRGKGGGIGLMERFVLDRLLLSKEEQQSILSALASLQETGAVREKEVLKKLEAFFKTEPQDWVSIDFSDWSGRREELFGQIKEAVLGRRILEFDYYGQQGNMSRRQVEPVQLVFKEYTWYVRAYCRVRGAMRLFKVLRMKRVEVMDESFELGERHGEAQEEKEEKWDAPDREAFCPEVVLRIVGKEAYRIYDRFEESEITVLPEGDYEIRFRYPMDDWVYGLILSFGDSARVLEPDWVRAELAGRIRRMAENY